LGVEKAAFAAFFISITKLFGCASLDVFSSWCIFNTND